MTSRRVCGRCRLDENPVAIFGSSGACARRCVLPVGVDRATGVRSRVAGEFREGRRFFSRNPKSRIVAVVVADVSAGNKPCACLGRHAFKCAPSGRRGRFWFFDREQSGCRRVSTRRSNRDVFLSAALDRKLARRVAGCGFVSFESLGADARGGVRAFRRHRLAGGSSVGALGIGRVSA